MTPRDTGGDMQEAATRWELIRDVLVLQLKLAVDALRDLLVSPVSLVAAVIDLVRGGERPGDLFYSVLAAGRRSEQIINLFGEADRTSAQPASLDALVAHVEKLVVEQYERGGVTASAKAAIDRSLDALGQVRPGKAKEEPPS